MSYCKENYGGIYEIINLINGKKYIGQTIDFENRKKLHFSYLRNGTHDNPHLQYSYNKYGENNFEFRIILYCEQFEMTRYKKRYFLGYFDDEEYAALAYNKKAIEFGVPKERLNKIDK